MKGLEVRLVDAGDASILFHTEITENPVSAEHFISFEDRIPKEETESLQTGRLGYIKYKLDDRLLWVGEFFPFGLHPSMEHRALVGKGVADEVQLIVAGSLLDVYGSGYSITHIAVGTRRERQLNRLGIERKRIYPLDEYVRAIRENMPAQKYTVGTKKLSRNDAIKQPEYK